MFASLAIDEPISESFYRAMAVLVAASPRALAIATPSAVLSGVARTARGGILVKPVGRWKAFLVPVTILGLNTGPTVTPHEGSTLIFVFNALCLRTHKKLTQHPSASVAIRPIAHEAVHDTRWDFILAAVPADHRYTEGGLVKRSWTFIV